MPQIPRYESKVSAPVLDLPTIPEAYAGQPWDVLEKVGEATTNLGLQINEKIERAQQASTLAQTSSQAAIRLQDLYNQQIQGTTFNTDPAAARQEWNSQVKELGSQLAGQIQDPQAKGLFTNQYLRLAAAHTASFSNAVRSKQVEIVKGSSMNALDNFSDAAAGAQDENIFHENIKGGLMTINGAIASGAVGYDDGVKLRDGFIKQTLTARAHNGIIFNPAKVMADIQDPNGPYAGLNEGTKAVLLSIAVERNEHLMREDRVNSEYQEKQRVTAANDYAYRYVAGVFGLGKTGGDYGRAFQYVMDPETGSQLGLTSLEQRTHVANVLLGEQSKFHQDQQLQQKNR